MSKLFDILEKIRVRPAMYIGRASVSDLFHFLVGFKTALRELKIKAIDIGLSTMSTFNLSKFVRLVLVRWNLPLNKLTDEPRFRERNGILRMLLKWSAHRCAYLNDLI